MEALGKVLRKGMNEIQSAHQTTQYEKLAQEPSDEEAEEDDIVFLQDGLVLHQNGFTKGKGNRHGNHTGSRCMAADEAVEIGLLQKGSISKSKSHELVQVKSIRCRMLMRRRLYWCLIVLLICLSVALIGVLVKTYYTLSPVSSREWQKRFSGFGSESCIRLVDVDGDGRMDIIFSMSVNLNMSALTLFNLSHEEMKAFCTQQGETYPCLGRIIALRGNDSHQLWMTKIHFGLFELNCGKIDVDRDGRPDCIGTGRLASVVAFNPRNGSVFWTAESSSLVDLWSAFNVVILPDFNGDGVPEVLLPHSSDPRFPPELLKPNDQRVHERYAGRLMLLDGASGRSIGRHLDIPQGRETYMSPVLHTFKDGSQYILFGSGGETVSGSLLAISVPNFYRHVLSLDSNAVVTNVSGSYSYWTFLPRLENQFILEIFRSEAKGVMVPPVCVDVNNDGIRDILALTFDGNLTLFEGLNLKPLWSVSFPGTESYSSPAPGYFNTDENLDFMMHFNHGSYPDYDFSMTVVIDGKTGQTIWALNSTRFVMTSDLVAKTQQDFHDVFMFRIKGRPNSYSSRRRRRSYRRNFARIQSDPKLAANQEYVKPTPNIYKRLARRVPGSGGRFGQSNRGSASDYPESGEMDRNYRNQPMQGDEYGAPFGGQMNANEDYARENGYDEPQRWMDPDYSYQDAARFSDMRNKVREEGSRRNGNFGDFQRNSDEEDNGQFVSHPSGIHSPSTLISQSTATLTPTVVPPTSLPPLIHPGCSPDFSIHATEVLVLDHMHPFSLLRIYQQHPQLLRYKLSADDMKHFELVSNKSSSKKKRHEETSASHDSHPSFNKDIELCTILESEERTTGAIGDVDGDGFLDLISIETLNARITDQFDGFMYSTKTTRLSKVNLELIMKKTSKQDFVTVQSVVTGKPFNVSETQIMDVRFRPASQQPWTAYLGTNGDSIY